MPSLDPMSDKPLKNASGGKIRRSQWDVDDLVKMSLRTMKSFLNDPDADKAKKAELASRIVAKLMPERVEHTHTLISLTDEVAHRLMLLMSDNVSRETISSDNKAIEIVPESPKFSTGNVLDHKPDIKVL